MVPVSMRSGIYAASADLNGVGEDMYALNAGVEAQLRMRHGSRLLVTTRLCETLFKSRTGHIFDPTHSQEYRHILEYNNLHDPHLKDYFYRPAMKERLIAKHFITPDMKVVSQIREYSAYRNYIEDEVANIRVGKEKEKELRKMGHIKKMGRYTLIDKEMTERRKQYLLRQEKNIFKKRYAIQLSEMKVKMKRRLELERRHIQRVKDVLKKHSPQVEPEKVNDSQKEQEEEIVRREEVDPEVQKQHASNGGERLKRLDEFESWWVDCHEDPSQEEEEIEKKKEVLKKHDDELKERERAIVLKELDVREHQGKPPSLNHLWVHLLQQQADIREREWGEIRRCGLEGWEAVKRQWEQLQVQLRLRRQAWRNEHTKLLQLLLSESSAQKLQNNKVIVSYRGNVPREKTDDLTANKPSSKLSVSVDPDEEAE